MLNSGHDTYPHLGIQRSRWIVVSKSIPLLGVLNTLSQGRRVALIPFVTFRSLGLPMTTHGDCRLGPQTNTSLFKALGPYSCALWKTSQEVTHFKIAPHQARLTVEFLANGIP